MNSGNFCKAYYERGELSSDERVIELVKCDIPMPPEISALLRFSKRDIALVQTGYRDFDLIGRFGTPYIHCVNSKRDITVFITLGLHSRNAADFQPSQDICYWTQIDLNWDKLKFMINLEKAELPFPKMKCNVHVHVLVNRLH